MNIIIHICPTLFLNIIFLHMVVTSGIKWGFHRCILYIIWSVVPMFYFLDRYYLVMLPSLLAWERFMLILLKWNYRYLLVKCPRNGWDEIKAKGINESNKQACVEGKMCWSSVSGNSMGRTCLINASTRPHIRQPLPTHSRCSAADAPEKSRIVCAPFCELGPDLLQPIHFTASG